MSEQSTGGRLHGHEVLSPDGSASIALVVGTAAATHTMTVIDNSLYRVANYGTAGDYVMFSWNGVGAVGTTTFAVVYAGDQQNVYIPAGTTTIYGSGIDDLSVALLTRQNG